LIHPRPKDWGMLNLSHSKASHTHPEETD